MILAIDTGNSHIVLGIIHQDGSIGPTMRMETNLTKTEYEYAADSRRSWNWAGWICPDVKAPLSLPLSPRSQRS